MATAAGALSFAAVAAAAVINGTPGNDVLRGTDQADEIHAFAGNDSIYAREGGGDVRAGSGDDGNRAGDGNDVVYGRRGNDLAAGGDGNGRLYGGSDSDNVLAATGTTVGRGTRETIPYPGTRATTRSSAAGVQVGSGRTHRGCVAGGQVTLCHLAPFTTCSPAGNQ